MGLKGEDQEEERDVLACGTEWVKESSLRPGLFVVSGVQRRWEAVKQKTTGKRHNDSEVF